MSPSRTHLLLIPSYNSGPILLRTVAEARSHWAPIWVVIDGSTDGSAEALEAESAGDPHLRLLRLPRNSGKGAAIFHALEQANRAGFSHVMTMDADGQHPASFIGAFMSASAAAPDAAILGMPIFDAGAPPLRVHGRKISNWWAGLETLSGDIGDSLFGFRVYPCAALYDVMRGTRWMRRFDFEPEAAVRLHWRGVRVVNMPAPVRYLAKEEGGVSHFHYGRDNVLLAWMHMRLVAGALLRLPSLMGRKKQESETKMSRSLAGPGPSGRSIRDSRPNG